MKKRFRHILRRSKEVARERLEQLRPTPAEQKSEDVRITNQTVAARREEVLGSARKFIYPLDTPRHRIIKWSVAIFITAIVGLFTFCVLELYKFQSTSTFIYGVTQVVPFPVAVVGSHDFVSYNDYLFELRHYMHYYETQQHTDFNTKAGQQQLAAFKQNALEAALQKAYVGQLASKYNLSVSDQEVDQAVALARSQNRLGASDDVFASVLSEFWGWSVQDFRRELKAELLAQKVVDRLDAAAHTCANQALGQLQQGADFAAVAKNLSDDQATKNNGGAYGFPIDQANTQLSPQVLSALFKLSPGQYSPIINTGYTLEIVKMLQAQGSQVQAAHIQCSFQPVTVYTQAQAASERTVRLIRV